MVIARQTLACYELTFLCTCIERTYKHRSSTVVATDTTTSQRPLRYVLKSVCKQPRCMTEHI